MDTGSFKEVFTSDEVKRLNLRITELETELNELHEIHSVTVRDGVAGVDAMIQQITEQSLIIKKLREALEAGPSTLHKIPNTNCKCSQCEFVRLRKEALATP